MNASGPQRSASEELLEQLMAAARRDEALAAPPRRSRRRRRRTLGVLAAVLLGGAAAAGAVDLISTGEPVTDRTMRSPRYEPPAQGAAELVTKARDPDGGAAWGVAIYTSDTGEACAVAGQVRGVQLGQIRDGTFHAYERGTSGTCADLSRLPLMSDRLTISGAKPRTIVYGRTRTPGRRVLINVDGKPYATRSARGGAYVFVFAGTIKPGDGDPRLGR